jgi:hypothetical protein
LKIEPGKHDELKKLKEELSYLRSYLGEDYLQEIEKNLGNLNSEIVVAVENQDNGKNNRQHESLEEKS